MAKRITVTSVLLGILSLALLLGVGCGPSTELTGTPIPNTLPDTRVTARPPDVLEAGFVVEFFWTGNDIDGRVDHFQWKISNNGTDGISVQDTLTFDPVTGDTLNPWFDITSSDSTFLVTADIPEFPGDPGDVDDPTDFNRSYQTHSFWVRAVDEDGGVDPSPALVSFTSTTLLPSITMIAPTAVVGQIEAAQLPSTVTFLFEGTDPDFSSGLPTQVRYLWRKALLPDNTYADTRNDFRNNLEYLVSFDDSLWSSWIPYDPNDDTRRIVLENQQQVEDDPFGDGTRNIFYAFAIQAKDTAGAVSVTRGYGNQVANVRITQGLSPNLRILEQYLGEYTGAGINLQTNIDIAAGQELNFSWTADASDYAGEIVSYRYGWDVTDVNDPNDPNWALLPGNSVQHRRSPPTSFASGVHTLTVQVEDNSNQLTRRVITLNVVPVPDPASQLPLLFVDDVFDSDSNSWPGPAGNPRDRDEFRDGFWIGGSPGVLNKVAGFDAGAHVIDTETEQIEYRDVVQYRSLVWAGKWVSFPNSGVARMFRPTNTTMGDVDKYIWLQPYQESVGNVLYASTRGLNAFLAESPYELPIVFESREGRQGGFETVGTVDVRRGFGERELPDGTTVQVGPLRYPYFTMGIATLDIMSPNASYYEYGLGLLVSQRRSKSCASMKGVAIDADFKERYMPQGGVFADTIWSDPVNIDWKDTWGPWYTDQNYPGDPTHPSYTDPLAIAYTWSNDEFYDADIVGRNTQYNLQICDDGELCVESMFRSVSRYDWVQQNMIEEGNVNWPVGFYGGQGQLNLDNVCGSNALSLDREVAITNDQIVAFIARKTAPNKPSQVGDVVFGFDPYRFENDQMEQVIQWVLGEHFGLSMNP